MGKTILKSHCKINLFLDVGKKDKKSRLHNIQTLVCLISLYDEIAIKKIKCQQDIIKFYGKFSKDIKKKNTLP